MTVRGPGVTARHDCPRCDGTGHVPDEDHGSPLCPECDGAGVAVVWGWRGYGRAHAFAVLASGELVALCSWIASSPTTTGAPSRRRCAHCLGAIHRASTRGPGQNGSRVTEYTMKIGDPFSPGPNECGELEHPGDQLMFRWCTEPKDHEGDHRTPFAGGVSTWPRASLCTICGKPLDENPQLRPLRDYPPALRVHVSCFTERGPT